MKLAFIGMGNMAYAILKGGCDHQRRAHILSGNLSVVGENTGIHDHL